MIIPALNEAPVIGRTLACIPAGLFDKVIVVDNGSDDGTAEIAARAGACVVSEPARGYGAACLRGLAELGDDTEAVVFMQADLSENPEEARLLLGPIGRGEADLVIGSRTMGHADPGALLLHQRLGNSLATKLIHLLYGCRSSDLGAFRAIRRDSLRLLGMEATRYAWTVEMQVKAIEAGLRVQEAPISYHRRVAGVNKISGQLWASLSAGLTILSTIVRLWLGYRYRSGAFRERSTQ